MTSVSYGMIEETYSLGNETRTSYGIAAYADPELDGTATVTASVHDITSNKKKLEGLIHKCNRLGLSTVHLYDVVEDFLND